MSKILRQLAQINKNQAKTYIKLQKAHSNRKSSLMVILLDVEDLKNGKKDKLMTKKLLNLLLIVSLNSAAEKSTPPGREKAIAKLLAALPAILQRADLGRIKIEPSEDGNSFTTTIYYKSLPQDTTKSLGQQPAPKTTPATVKLPEAFLPASSSSSVNHEAGLCQCSRCEYIRKNNK